jgi:hypothetical protein
MYYAPIKEVVINCGWVGVVRAGRVGNGNKNHVGFALSESSRRDSAHRVS